MAKTSSPGTRDRSNFASIFMFIALIVGASAGTALGASLDGSMGDRRGLSILTALFALVVIWLVRHFLGKSFPAAFMKPRGKFVPPAVWLGAVFSSVIGGLAGHDIGLLFGVNSGVLFGLIAGTIAGISMSMLMIVYFHEHPEEGTEY